MDPLELIDKYYPPGSPARELLLEHSRLVAEKAAGIARRLGEPSLDLGFVYEAAMLHDIGIFLINAPRLGCTGEKPYICHGYLGRELLEKEGLPRHALVAENHIGVGLTAEDIRAQGLLLPLRDMVPRTTEEKIISFADKFFSKGLRREKSVEELRISILRHGAEKLAVFDTWLRMFG
jgi:uncharacterized protein